MTTNCPLKALCTQAGFSARGATQSCSQDTPREPDLHGVDFEHLHLMTPAALAVTGPLLNAGLTVRG